MIGWTRFSARLALFLAAAASAGCYNLLPSSGGGQTRFTPPRMVRASDVAVPAGYKVEVAAQGLTFPTGVAFDDAGTPYVTSPKAGSSKAAAFCASRPMDGSRA